MRQTPPKKADKSQRVLPYLSLPSVCPPAGILEDWQQRLVRLEHGVQTDEEEEDEEERGEEVGEGETGQGGWVRNHWDALARVGHFLVVKI